MKKTIIPSIILLLGFLLTGALVLAQNNSLTIEPDGGNFSINSTAQFQALFNGQDVTSQASWSIHGSFSAEPKRGELLAPGRFRLLVGGSDVFVTARYQGQTASVGLTVEGGSAHGRTGFSPLDRNLNVGESIELKYFRGEETFCQNPPCTGVTEEVPGQWFTTTPNVLENLGGGLFRAIAEGYGVARITPFDGVPSSAQEYIGVVDPTKPISAAFDVKLVKRNPVYTWVDAKYHDGSGYGPFTNIDYIPTSSGGGRFAVVGECSDGRRVSIPGVAGGHQVELEGGGLYVLSEEGQFIAKGDVCLDTATPVGCYEIGGCGVGKNMSFVDDGRFILDAGVGPSRTPYRSALLYDIGGSSVSRENRLFFTDWNDLVDGEEEEEVTQFRHVAYANGIMVGRALETTGYIPPRIPGFPGAGNPTAEKNIFYSVPEFQRLAEISVPTTCPSGSACSGGPPITQAVYTPIFGLGEYFVTSNLGGLGPYEVYRMPSRQELRDGKKPQKVQDLTPGFQHIHAFTYDATNPNRVMLVGFGSGVGTTRPYAIYGPGTNGLTVVKTGTLNTTFISGYNIALSGEYIAYASCTANPGTHPLINTVNISSCELIVEKNGQKLSVEPLPLNAFTPRSFGGIPGIAVSPSGKILVSAHNSIGLYGENDYLYLYQIGTGTGVPPQPPGPGDIPNIPPPGQTYNLDLQFFLDSASSYVNQLTGTFLGGNTANTNSQSSSSNCPPTTEAEIRQFQCAYNIVCSGTIETTGFGNLGPITRAKIAEIYPATVRQSCGLNY
jgi:hypothetical protein